MNSAERRLKLLLILQSRKKEITVNYLANYFEVSRRTIFRDLRILQDMEVPVAYDENQGYTIPRGYSIPPLMFSPKEIATIMVGLSFVKSQQDNQMLTDAKAVEIKIQNVVPPELKELMNVLDNKVIIDPYLSLGLPKKEGGDWYLISNAIANGSSIKFTYEKKVRILSPLTLVYYSDHWNVIGHNEESDDIRNFKLDKISILSLHDKKHASQNTTYSISDLIYRDSGKQTDIKLRVKEEAWSEFRRTCPSKINNINVIDRSFECEIKFDNLNYINKWLLRFGDEIMILSPAELIDLRLKLLHKMM